MEKNKKTAIRLLRLCGGLIVMGGLGAARYTCHSDGGRHIIQTQNKCRLMGGISKWAANPRGNTTGNYHALYC